MAEGSSATAQDFGRRFEEPTVLTKTPSRGLARKIIERVPFEVVHVAEPPKCFRQSGNSAGRLRPPN
jgi:hypothetical protein